MASTVGEKLREARERSNLSVHDVSETTKIRTDHIIALEEGNFDVFSAPVYIRGFVRSYSGMLKLNVTEILAELDRELGRTERFKEHPKLTPKQGVVDRLMLHLTKIKWSVALPLILLALILFVSVFGYRLYRERQTRDPLKDLGPGLYQPKTSGEVIPFPPQTNR